MTQVTVQVKICMFLGCWTWALCGARPVLSALQNKPEVIHTHTIPDNVPIAKVTQPCVSEHFICVQIASHHFCLTRMFLMIDFENPCEFGTWVQFNTEVYSDLPSGMLLSLNACCGTSVRGEGKGDWRWRTASLRSSGDVPRRLDGVSAANIISSHLGAVFCHCTAKQTTILRTAKQLAPATL